MNRILALRHHLEDHPGLIGDAFVELGYDVDVVMMDESTPTPSLDGYDHLLVLGSKCAVYDHEVRAAWFSRELELLQQADARGIPVFGICFGAQALCVAFGGEVGPSPNPEIGWYEVETVGDAPLPRGPYFEFHFDHCSLPATATLLARNENAVQAFTIGRHFGVQFHPELDVEQLRDWFAGGADDEARAFGTDLETLVAQTTEQEPAARERARALVSYYLSR